MNYTLEAAAPPFPHHHGLPSPRHIPCSQLRNQPLLSSVGDRVVPPSATSLSPSGWVALGIRGAMGSSAFPSSWNRGLLIKVWDKMGGALLVLGDVAQCWGQGSPWSGKQGRLGRQNRVDLTGILAG